MEINAKLRLRARKTVLHCLTGRIQTRGRRSSGFEDPIQGSSCAVRSNGSVREPGAGPVSQNSLLERGVTARRCRVSERARPACDLASAERATGKVHEPLICGGFFKPSDGLEPSTPPYHRATRREPRVSREAAGTQDAGIARRRVTAGRRGCPRWCSLSVPFDLGGASGCLRGENARAGQSSSSPAFGRLPSSGRSDDQASPASCASRAIWTRLLSSSFSSTRETCAFTVATLM